MKKLKKRYWALIGVCTLIVVYALILPLFQTCRIVRDIAQGDIQYFPKIGWVDMGHANPSGPSRMVRAIDKHRGGTLTYHQEMKKTIMGITLIVRMTNRYSIPVELGKDRSGILRYVFENVSGDFEDLQASHPFKPLCGRGLGDINGDRVALLRSMKMKLPKELDRPLSTREALKEYFFGGEKNERSRYLHDLLPKFVWVYKYDSTVSYHIEY